MLKRGPGSDFYSLATIVSAELQYLSTSILLAFRK